MRTIRPATIPQIKQLIILTASKALPRAALYIISWGFSKIELIIKAARKSSFNPLREKAAQMGIVPYIHKGEAIPRALAKTSPTRPGIRLPIHSAAVWIQFFTKTETQEPIMIPRTQ